MGVDPGLKGGLAAIRQGMVMATPMPVAGGEIDAVAVAQWMRGIIGLEYDEVIVCVEKVGAMPKQGVSSTFTFGKGYGKILGVCAALGMPILLVTPQAWKKLVLEGTPKDKDAAIDYCRRVWPMVPLILKGCRVPHDGMADALCLAEFARRSRA